MSFKILWRTYCDRKGGKTLYARFYIPVRRGTSIIWKRTERSTRTNKISEARAVVEHWRREAWSTAFNEEQLPSNDRFNAAVEAYAASHGTKNSTYLAKLLPHLGNRSLKDIDQAVLNRTAKLLYPGRSPGTINRQVFTPVLAVLNHAAQGQSTNYISKRVKRPSGHSRLPPLGAVPDAEWFAAVLRCATPPLRALILFCRMHGRREGEALSRRNEHFDAQRGTLDIWDGKGRQHIQVKLAAPVLSALIKAQERSVLREKRSAALFGTFHRSTYRKWLLRACATAGVPYVQPKLAGRHAFATELLRAGKSLKHVQLAGRWKTLSVVADRYAHLEQSEVDRSTAEESLQWYETIEPSVSKEGSKVDTKGSCPTIPQGTSEDGSAGGSLATDTKAVKKRDKSDR